MESILEGLSQLKDIVVSGSTTKPKTPSPKVARSSLSNSKLSSPKTPSPKTEQSSPSNKKASSPKTPSQLLSSSPQLTRMPPHTEHRDDDYLDHDYTEPYMYLLPDGNVGLAYNPEEYEEYMNRLENSQEYKHRLERLVCSLSLPNPV